MKRISGFDEERTGRVRTWTPGGRELVGGILELARSIGEDERKWKRTTGISSAAR